VSDISREAASVENFLAFLGGSGTSFGGDTGRNDRTYCGHNVHSGHIRYILGTY